MTEPYQIEMQRQIDVANALSTQRFTVPVDISWQDYADVLSAAVEVRKTKGPKGRHTGLRLVKLAEYIRDALDRNAIAKPKTLELPPKI